MSEEQWEALQEQLGVNLGDPPKPTKRAAFDLEEQDDDDFATFLAEVEKNLNEAADRELEKEAEAEARVSELKESVNE
jgi:ribosomal protein S20